MEWLEHCDPDCTGVWHYSRPARAFYCSDCREWHHLTEETRKAYSAWVQVENFLMLVKLCG